MGLFSTQDGGIGVGFKAALVTVGVDGANCCVTLVACGASLEPDPKSTTPTNAPPAMMNNTMLNARFTTFSYLTSC